MNDNINQSAMLPVGTLLRGMYRIDSYLSSGGFGNTYVATDVELEETVAVKEFFIKGVAQRDDNNTTVSVSNTDNRNLFGEQLQKFKKEARRLWKLKNPHIVGVHALFEENGTAYYVMDYIRGESLSERLKRTREPLTEKEALDCLSQVLDALDCVHHEGLWHLDLKPANIMIDGKGNVSLIDFGASKQRSHSGGATTSTAVSYTNGYAPREQMEQNLEKFGPWTDIYALGATLYNLVTARRPPMPSDIDDDRTPDKHLALPMPDGLSANTRQLILSMMTTDRLDRPQSVDEVRSRMGNKAEVVTVVADDNEATVVAAGQKHDDDATQPLQKKPEKETPQPKKKETPKRKEPVKEPPRQKEPVKPQKPEPKLAVDIPDAGGKQGWLKYGVAAGVVAAVVAAFLLFGGGSDKPATTDNAAAEAVKTEIAKNYVTDLPCKNSHGDFTYTGTVNEGRKPDGRGTAKFTNGDVYEGPFVNGNMQGDNVVFKLYNGDTFEGSFFENHFQEGKYTSKESGEYFEGTYDVNGNPSHGKWYNKNGKLLQTV